MAEVRCTLRWEDGTVAGGVTLLCSDTGEVVADSEGLISLRVSEYIGGFAGYQNSCGRATFALDGVELAAEQRQPRDSNRDGVLSAEERFQVSRLPDGGVTPAAAPPGDWVSGGDNCEYRLAPWPASGE